MSDGKEIRIKIDVLARSYGIDPDAIYQVYVTSDTRTLVILHDTPSR